MFDQTFVFYWSEGVECITPTKWQENVFSNDG